MEPVPYETIIDTDQTLGGETEGPITVKSGATLTLVGAHEGSVALESSATLVVLGILRGGLDIGSLGTAIVRGEVSGPIEIRVAGTLVVEENGAVTGDVSNFGSFTNKGVREGYVEGRTPDDRPGATEISHGHGR